MVMNPGATRRSDRRGMITVLLALLLILCLGIIAIALDGGMMMEDQRVVQAAADAAALAAATDLFVNYNTNQGQDPDGTARKSAQTIAAANGFDTSNSTVTVNIPPVSGPFAGNPYGYAEVIITYNQQPYFSRIWGVANLAVTARSVARGQWLPTNNYGTLSLGSNDNQALYLPSSGSLTVNNGGSVVVNSSSNQAASITGSGKVTAQDIYIDGGYVGGPKFIGTLTSPSPPVADPIAPLPTLDPSSLTQQSNGAMNLSGDATLSPGLYVGGVTFSGGTLTLQPGIYYFQDGGLSITANTLTANSVLIYNGPGSNHGSNGSINIAVSGTLTISPSNSGPYQGISIWQDDSINNAVYLTFNGSNGSLIGTVYVPNAGVRINGSQNLNGAQIVGRRLKILSSGSLIVDSTSQRRNTRRIQLVE